MEEVYTCIRVYTYYFIRDLSYEKHIVRGRASTCQEEGNGRRKGRREKDIPNGAATHSPMDPRTQNTWSEMNDVLEGTKSQRQPGRPSLREEGPEGLVSASGVRSRVKLGHPDKNIPLVVESPSSRNGLKQEVVERRGARKGPVYQVCFLRIIDSLQQEQLLKDVSLLEFMRPGISWSL